MLLPTVCLIPAMLFVPGNFTQIPTTCTIFLPQHVVRTNCTTYSFKIANETNHKCFSSKVKAVCILSYFLQTIRQVPCRQCPVGLPPNSLSLRRQDCPQRRSLSSRLQQCVTPQPETSIFWTLHPLHSGEFSSCCTVKQKSCCEIQSSNSIPV